MSKRSICRVWAYTHNIQLGKQLKETQRQLAEQKMQADWLESSSVKRSSFCHLLFQNDVMNVFLKLQSFHFKTLQALEKIVNYHAIPQPVKIQVLRS